MHVDTVAPLLEPNRPGSHGPLHVAVVRPDVLPYVPALQFTHTPDPDTLYCPAGHSNAVDDNDPLGHAYPAEQLPSHDDDVAPTLAPYRPATHGPLHVDIVTPYPLPNWPAGHGVHVDAPAVL